MRMAKALPLGF
uniref:Uncharacterized protein n=1 Tax=Arundo donax TaxID=35708 RepID=A0A0A8ZQJ8_ARUDO